jgi:glycosyltransferase involved in cell wall biosynthesis
MYPFVSVVVPTANRRFYIPQLLRNYFSQDYPATRRELLILDDGEDCVKDLLEGLPGVRYLRSAPRQPIGGKRNRLISEAHGEILVHMDDDDFYPATRVSHAVTRLILTGREVAGASHMLVFNAAHGEMASVGPYGENHATGNTLAYTRDYLKLHHYADDCLTQEEPEFLDHFTAPMAQLEARKTILAVVHGRNTGDKSQVIFRRTRERLKDLVLDKASRDFYRHQLPEYLRLQNRPYTVPIAQP